MHIFKKTRQLGRKLRCYDAIVFLVFFKYILSPRQQQKRDGIPFELSDILTTGQWLIFMLRYE